MGPSVDCRGRRGHGRGSVSSRRAWGQESDADVLGNRLGGLAEESLMLQAALQEVVGLRDSPAAGDNNAVQASAWNWPRWVPAGAVVFGSRGRRKSCPARAAGC